MSIDHGFYIRHILLLFALIAAEAPYPDSGIQNIGDALWYSLVTITTVGYGDLYPMSAAGKVIGSFFLLLSIGALAFAVHLAYDILTGRLIPRIRLLRNRHRPWFLFSQVNAASLALAGDLAAAQPESLMIFCRSHPPANLAEVRNLHTLFLPDEAGGVLRFSGARCAERTIVFVGENALANRDEALALQAQEENALRIFCLSDEDSRLPGISCFDPYTCCARQFWQAYPVREKETSVVIVGSGEYAQALLSQGMLVNCRVPFAATAYHLFGDWRAYRRNHPQLCRALEADGAAHESGALQDELFFHDDPWNSDPALLERADRIIFCSDEENENARDAGLLDRLFAHRARVYVRTTSRSVPGTCFGRPQEIYTAELVMQQGLDKQAKAMHEAYRSAGGDAPAWEALSPFLRDSNRAAADHMMTKVRLLLPQLNDASPDAQTCRRAYDAYRAGGPALQESCRENEHERWMRFYLLYNWQYAPQRDNALRRHPSLVPFSQLSETEKAKDDNAWLQMERFGACCRPQETL